jgi:penicillin-insensitive murein DD-endopeptidase
MTRSDEATSPIEMEPIGVVRSAVVAQRDSDWGAVESTIELVPELATSPRGELPRRAERRRVWRRRAALALLVALWPPGAGGASVCLGTPERGELRNGCQLPREGVNFQPYSELGVAAGRTYAHCVVASVVADGFADLARNHPDVHFVYGESGFAAGGACEPHKSHQNGLSVDFFVPVRDARGRSVPVPTSLLNRWGYDLEFDARGKNGDLTIDFEAIAWHLASLERAARARGVAIRRVFFDTRLQPRLRETSGWPAISSLSFSTRQGWWRHDEHYHVDFAVPCRPLR